MSLRVGLTGGIGSGKTAVTKLFAARDVPVIDADIVARQVVQPGQPALDEIVALVGSEVIDSQGQLQRSVLRTKIFQDESLRRQIEGILHPRIRKLMQAQAQAVAFPYCVLAIPLLLESAQKDLVDRVLVVDCPESLQISRVMMRDHLTAREVEAIMLSQASRRERLTAAHEVIINDGDLAHLERQVDARHRQYLAQASATSAGGNGLSNSKLPQI